MSEERLATRDIARSMEVTATEPRRAVEEADALVAQVIRRPSGTVRCGGGRR